MYAAIRKAQVLAMLFGLRRDNTAPQRGQLHASGFLAGAHTRPHARQDSNPYRNAVAFPPLAMTLAIEVSGSFEGTPLMHPPAQISTDLVD
jgi:hypothetical protein